MPGSPATRPAPDLPPGPRLALVIATGTYTDAELRRLRAPAQDAEEFAQALADASIGGFEVTQVTDQPAREIRLAIEDLLVDRSTQDLVLVYISCHGLLDARGKLYFSAVDTRKDRLAATGIESTWLLDQMEHCRARRQIIILDSCFSGAFSRGAKGGADLNIESRFLGEGRGRTVLTASTATEYSFEGKPTASAGSPGSVFTSALIKGLFTGAADSDHDGLITVDDAYAYAYGQIRSTGAAQTPQRWSYGAEGDIVLARSPAGALIIPVPLPESLRLSLDSPYPNVRIGAVNELGIWLASRDPARSLAGRQSLIEIGEKDIPNVAAVARKLLSNSEGGASTPPVAASSSLGESKELVSEDSRQIEDSSRKKSIDGQLSDFFGREPPIKFDVVMRGYSRVQVDEFFSKVDRDPSVSRKYPRFEIVMRGYDRNQVDEYIRDQYRQIEK